MNEEIQWKEELFNWEYYQYFAFGDQGSDAEFLTHQQHFWIEKMHFVEPFSLGMWTLFALALSYLLPESFYRKSKKKHTHADRSK